MLATVRTAALYGVEACAVQVEVDVSFGMLGVAKLLELHQDGKPLPAPPPPHQD